MPILKNLQYLNQFLAQEREKQERDEKKEKLNKAIQTAAETFEGTKSIGEVTSAYNESIKAAAQSGAPKALNTINVLYQNAVNEIQYNEKQKQEEKIAKMLRDSDIPVPKGANPSTVMQAMTAIKQMKTPMRFQIMKNGTSYNAIKYYDIGEGKYDETELLGKSSLSMEEKMKLIKTRADAYNTPDNNLPSVGERFKTYQDLITSAQRHRENKVENLEDKAEEFNSELSAMEYGANMNFPFGGSPDLGAKVDDLRKANLSEIKIARQIIGRYGKDEGESFEKFPLLSDKLKRFKRAEEAEKKIDDFITGLEDQLTSLPTDIYSNSTQQISSNFNQSQSDYSSQLYREGSTRGYIGDISSRHQGNYPEQDDTSKTSNDKKEIKNVWTYPGHEDYEMYDSDERLDMKKINAIYNATKK